MHHQHKREKNKRHKRANSSYYRKALAQAQLQYKNYTARLQLPHVSPAEIQLKTTSTSSSYLSCSATAWKINLHGYLKMLLIFLSNRDPKTNLRCSFEPWRGPSWTPRLSGALPDPTIMEIGGEQGRTSFSWRAWRRTREEKLGIR